ncbi:MAG: TetR/AcrR family transcriptional regulator [Actinomycetes bacterium]
MTAEVDSERPSGPRSRKGAQTRARLVEAAKAVFEEDGFRDTRITDIAERAGLSHGSFYHYFDSKEQIFREVAEAMDDHLSAPLGDVALAAPTEATPRERIREGNRNFLESYRKEARLISEIEQVSRYDKQLNAARFAHQRDYGERLASSFRQLQRHGLVDAKLDPVVAAYAVGAMVTHFAELWLVRGVLDCSFDTAVDQLTRLVANAVGLPDDESGGRPPRRRKPR